LSRADLKGHAGSVRFVKKTVVGGRAPKRIEAHRRLRGARGVGGGVPFPPGRDLGRGLYPSPEHVGFFKK